MTLFTIGYAQKSAEMFFELLRRHRVELLIDVRLWNSSQLAGYTKSRDLAYFLRTIAGCDYAHELRYAPDAALLDGYKSGGIDWSGYVGRYHTLLDERGGVDDFRERYGGRRVCLLCAEATPARCHRRLLAERIAALWADVEVVHL